ncbi:MAG TPA: HoxN/HupN/NixA family nickel/cobalt transporter [Reyranella sp.]|nr:HoxN/HupN/NixA family nickel/cobalt transporter [Reyranella sp.]
MHTKFPAGLIRLYGLLALFNVVAWALALWLFHAPSLWGLALLAYGLGLRHAVDADHIAAIDNVTRKLVQQGERPMTVGFFFALGHSAVVLLAVIAVAAAATLVTARFAAFRDFSGTIGTAISVLFLFAIALVNLVIFTSVWRALGRVRAGLAYVEDDLDRLLDGRGLLARLFRPLFRLIKKSWHMFPLGFLFGLGFDTATEVSLLGIAASETARGISLWSILVFPLLFAAGMSLIDTTDGVLMLGAYDWARLEPARKLRYNLAITLASVIVAVAVGGIEAASLVAGRLDLAGPLWVAIQRLGEHSTGIGLTIIGLFAAAWFGAMLVQRLGERAASRSR